MDGSVWRRPRKNHETRKPARVTHQSVLWQRGSPRRNSCLEHETADFVSVPQANQRREKDVVGEKAEAARSTALAMESNLDVLAASRGENFGDSAGVRFVIPVDYEVS